MYQHNYKKLVVRLANVFATYKVDPHSEDAPIQEVVDHLIRCVRDLLPLDDQDWFATAATLNHPMWRYEAPVD